MIISDPDPYQLISDLDPDPGRQCSGSGSARIRIRPDPKLFGFKDPDLDPKVLFSDPDPPLFHTKLKICFNNVLKMEQIHHNFIHNT